MGFVAIRVSRCSKWSCVVAATGLSMQSRVLAQASSLWASSGSMKPFWACPMARQQSGAWSRAQVQSTPAFWVAVATHISIMMIIQFGTGTDTPPTAAIRSTAVCATILTGTPGMGRMRGTHTPRGMRGGTRPEDTRMRASIRCGDCRS